MDALANRTPLRDPVALRGLLAPVLVRSEAEQKRFYEVFDRYWEELNVVEPEPEPVVIEKPSFWKRFWPLFLVLGLLIGGAVYYLGWVMPDQDTDEHPTLSFEMREPANTFFQAGDTVFCKNTTKLAGFDTSQYYFSWYVIGENDATELTSPNSFHWTFVCPDAGTADKKVVLKLHHKQLEVVKEESDFLLIQCSNRPAMPRVELPNEIKEGEAARFAIVDAPKPHLRYTWTTPDTVAEGRVFLHHFRSTGQTRIQLTIKDTVQTGICSRDTSFSFNIGNDRVVLPFKSLTYDTIPVTARFRWPVWLLLSLLGLMAAWFWWRWSQRPAPLPPDSTPNAAQSTLPNRSNTSDQPPYYIPFREQKGVLRSAREQFRFGDALRLRNEAEDATLDVPATLRATIDRGGYPQFRFRYRMRPTEYLFLVDEQMPGKHLARLFWQVAETLRKQDVVLDIVWYDSSFRRFWGAGLPKNVNLDGLRRFFPQHRLVLLGDGHGLLDPIAHETPRLRPDIETDLQGWPQRMLLTAQPPDDWNWREHLLYRQFGLYPADLKGILDAASFVESGMQTEERPVPFEDWKRQQIEARTEHFETNYRRWRTLGDHEAYLKEAIPAAASDLLRWLCAIAVHPSPTWEITLAVGKALRIPINHDRLLILARIPWMQDGQLPPRLRRELWTALDDADERTARQAIKAELEAVRHLTEGSHAAYELEAALVLQSFVLDPENPEHIEAIAAYLDADALTRAQEDELNLSVQRIEAKKVALSNNNIDTTPRGIREWISERLPKPEDAPPPPPKPFFTADFWRASAATLLLVLLSPIIWLLNDTVRLDTLAFGQENTYIPGRDQLRSNAFVQEYWEADKAVLLNNQGVNLGIGVRLDTAKTGIVKAIEIPKDYEQADALFNNAAMARNDDYPLAALNKARNFINGANAILARTNLRDSFLIAANYFGDVERFARGRFPTEQREAAHGRGLSFFYAQQRDSALATYQRLQAQGYFDTLHTRPNLETLLGIKVNRIVDVSGVVRSDGSVQTSVLFQTGLLRTRPQLVVELINAQGAIIAKGAEASVEMRPGQYQLSIPLVLRVPGIAWRSDSMRIYLYDAVQSVENALYQNSANNRTGRLAQRVVPFVASWQPKPVTTPTTPDTNPTTIPTTTGSDPTTPSGTTPSETPTGGTVTPDPDGTGRPNTGGQVIQPVALTPVLPDIQVNLLTNPEARPGIRQPPITRKAAIKGIVLHWTATEGDAYSMGRFFELSTTTNASVHYIVDDAVILQILPDEEFAFHVGTPSTQKATDLIGTSGASLNDLTIGIELCDSDKSARDWNKTRQNAIRLTRALLQKHGLTVDNLYRQYDLTGKPSPKKLVDELSWKQFKRAVQGLSENEDPKLATIIADIQKNMVRVAAGTFRMGCTPEQGEDCQYNEKPDHDVTLSPYSIGRTEVTNEQFAAFLNDYGSTTVKDGPYKGEVMWKAGQSDIALLAKSTNQYGAKEGREKQPVIYVSWYSAYTFCAWLSDKTGQNYRLPTEAEWEYAARGGGKAKKQYKYAGSDDIDKVAWYGDVGIITNGIHTVAGKQANDLGLYDMSGNAWEWCGNWLGAYEDKGKPDLNPMGDGSGSGRVLRGGSRVNYKQDCRVAYRDSGAPAFRGYNIGFRLARAN